MKHTSHPFAVAALVLSIPFAAAAQQQPPAPDFGPMAQSLGVSETLIQSCLPRPERGARPERPNVNAVTVCLQGENPSLTIDQVGQVLQANQPQPPARGNN